MTHSTPKQLAMVGRIGPAFSLSELLASHAVLDRASVPRRLQGQQLTLPERISFLNGMLAQARSIPIKQIFIISKKELDGLIHEQYQENAGESCTGQDEGVIRDREDSGIGHSS